MEEMMGTQLELQFDLSREREVREAWEEVRVDFMDLWKQMEALLDRQHLSISKLTVEYPHTEEIAAEGIELEVNHTTKAVT